MFFLFFDFFQAVVVAKTGTIRHIVYNRIRDIMYNKKKKNCWLVCTFGAFYQITGTMANKTISMTQLKRIIQLKTEGYSKLSISQKLGLHRATLNDYLKKLEATGKNYQELLSRSDDYLSSVVFNSANTRVPDIRYAELEKRFSSSA